MKRRSIDTRLLAVALVVTGCLGGPFEGHELDEIDRQALSEDRDLLPNPGDGSDTVIDDPFGGEPPYGESTSQPKGPPEVTGRPDRMEKLLPFVSEYGAGMVALLWGAEGTPRDENERRGAPPGMYQGNGVVSHAFLAENLIVGSVQVSFEITHEDPGQLEIILRHAGESVMIVDGLDDPSGWVERTVDVDGFDRVQGHGPWTLIVRERGSTGRGTLDSGTLDAAALHLASVL